MARLRWLVATGTKPVKFEDGRMIDFPIWPGKHRELLRVRKIAGLTLRRAGDLLGLTLRELSAIESGEAEFVAVGDFDLAMNRLKDAAWDQARTIMARSIRHGGVLPPMDEDLLRRLQRLYPERYAEVHAEEKAKAGQELNPLAR